MNPVVKKAIIALGIKEGIERIQDMRKPKKSLLGRIGPFGWLLALGGIGAFLYKSGKLDGIVGKVRGDMTDETIYTPSSVPSAPAPPVGDKTPVGASR